MRRAALHHAAVLLLGAGGGCVLVSDLDHQLTGAGGDASQSSASTGQAPSTSTSTATAGDGGAAPTSSQVTGTGGASGVGGAGGGGGASCSFAGEGPGEGPWSLTLGPVPTSAFGPPHDVAFDGERVVIGLVARPPATDGGAGGAGGGGGGGGDAPEPEPLLLDGELVIPGNEARYVVGWVDDGGASRAWPMEAAVPGAAAGIDVQPTGDGQALVAVSGAVVADPSKSPAMIVPVDLCDGTEAAPILVCEQGVRGISLDHAADGRMAIALHVIDGADCDVLPGDCGLPAGIGTEDTVLFHVDPTGGCASVLIREDDEGNGYTYSSQNGVAPTLADDGAVFVVGVYDGDLFQGDAAIATGEPHYLEGGREGSFDSFHRFLARFEVDGAALRTDDAVDLGRVPVGLGGNGAVWRDGAAVVVGGAIIGSQPTGPFDPPVSLTGAGYIDVLAGVFPTPAAPTSIDWQGGNSVDVPWRVSSTDAGMMVGGWSSSIEATFAPCDDPAVVADGTIQGGGCAFFMELDASAELVQPFVVDAAEDETLDVGYGAYALPAGDAIVVGATSGTITLDRTIDPPPDGFLQLYVARR